MYSFFIVVKSYNMAMAVYIEYAIIDNLVIKYLLIKTATRSELVKTSFLRLFLSATLGTVVAVILPLISLQNKYLIFTKLTLCLLIVLIAGKYQTIKKYIFTCLLFILFTFLCGGFIIALFNLAMIDYESYFLSNYDSLMPIGITVFLIYIASKALTSVVTKLLKERNLRPFLRECVLVINKKKFIVKGFIDSGNGLYDTRSGLPIIVCSNSLFEKLKSQNIKKSLSNLTFDTVSGSSTMALYVIDKLLIYNGIKVNIFNNVLLGVSPFGFNSSSYDLLLHPTLL